VIAARLARETIGILQKVIENRKRHNREQTWSGALERKNLLHKTTMVSRCVAWLFFWFFVADALMQFCRGNIRLLKQEREHMAGEALLVRMKPK
jgi:hypothetical protein